MMRGFRDKEYRDAFATALVRRGLATQIGEMRRARGWTVEDLAIRLGVSPDAVCRLENPTSARMSFATLFKLASVFDVALDARFVAFSEIADDARHHDAAPPAFSDETR
jgi:transcriptional regulator with XRE-family HTH domain